jgi:hypothetical protein
VRDGRSAPRKDELASKLAQLFNGNARNVTTREIPRPNAATGALRRRDPRQFAGARSFRDFPSGENIRIPVINNFGRAGPHV